MLGLSISSWSSLAGASRSPAPPHPAVAAALAEFHKATRAVFLYSGIVNILMFVGPLYMLQVYDRVLASGSVPTLVALSVMLLCAYAFQGLLDAVRSRLVARSALKIDRHLAGPVHDAVMQLGRRAADAGRAQQPLQDLDQLRSFLTGSGPIALIDLPWIPAFLAICFLVHPWLGMLSLGGGIVLSMLAMASERACRDLTRDAATGRAGRTALIEADRRNGEAAGAMGMCGDLRRRWLATNETYLVRLTRLGDIAGTLQIASKMMRQLLQSAILGLGAYLAIQQEISPGAIIAASIMMGRALAPAETLIANWRPFIAARQGLRRLSETLGALTGVAATTRLPAPLRSLTVDNLVVAAPGRAGALLTHVAFQLTAGEAVGVIGPSGSGKTALARTLVGAWPAARGSVCVDGAALTQWDAEALGRHVGYVPQSVDLFDGSIAQNIARMSASPDAEKVIAAAQAAHAHTMILRQPQGYDTLIGEDGMTLSAGQRQRLALARALYDDPFLLVLDEPNANLDAEGDAALQSTIRNAKARGAIVVLIAHRPASLACCDKVLFLADGRQQRFGPRDDVLRLALRPAAAAQGNLKVVG